jgi:threonine/homoserine efflux transporter RhtA
MMAPLSHSPTLDGISFRHHHEHVVCFHDASLAGMTKLFYKSGQSADMATAVAKHTEEQHAARSC